MITAFLHLSLRRMAQALGVTHATLIRHFRSKDRLVNEVIDHIRADFLAGLQHDSGLLDAATATGPCRPPQSARMGPARCVKARSGGAWGQAEGPNPVSRSLAPPESPGPQPRGGREKHVLVGRVEGQSVSRVG